MTAALATAGCSSSSDDDDPTDAGNTDARDAGASADTGDTGGADGGMTDDPAAALVGAWVGFEVAGIKVAAQHNLDVTAADEGDNIAVAAMELRADGSMVLTDTETYARSPSEWVNTESGLWRVTQDGELEIVAQGEVGTFRFEINADRLTIRDGRNEVALYEAVGDAPAVAASLLTSFDLYQVNKPQNVRFTLAGDCPECAQASVLYFSFDGGGTMDIVRMYFPSSRDGIPTSYPFQADTFGLDEVAVCGDRPAWSLDSDLLTLDIPRAPAWTLRAELFGALSLREGGATVITLQPIDGDPFDAIALETADLLRLCRDVGVRPAGYSWFAPEDWSKPQLRARTLDEDCPAENSDFIGYLDGGPGQGRLAGRVVIPSFPFTVHGVRFQRAYDPNSTCRDTLPARVEIFRSSTTSPPSVPRIDRQFVTNARFQADDRTVEVIFLDPLRVADGNELFVAIEIQADGTSSTCIRGCNQVSAEATNRSWIETDTGWEVFGAPDAPFAYDIEAIGVTP